MTASTLARTMPPAGTGALATRSGASSPEIASHASPPASCPAAITRTGTSTTSASVSPRGCARAGMPAASGREFASVSATPARDRAAAESIPCAAARAAASAAATESGAVCMRWRGRWRRRRRRSRGRRNVARTARLRARADEDCSSPARRPVRRRRRERRAPASRRCWSRAGAWASSVSDLRKCDPRQGAVGHDRAQLQPDHERRADHRGDHLRDQPGAPRADARNRATVSAIATAAAATAGGDDNAIDREPSCAAVRRQNVDERRRQAAATSARSKHVKVAMRTRRRSVRQPATRG